MSDKVVAEYLVETAKTARTPQDLLSRIQNQGMLTIDGKIKVFLYELFDRCGPDVKEKKMSRLLKDTLEMKEKRYDLVESSSDDDVDLQPSKSKSKKKKFKKSSKSHDRGGGPDRKFRKRRNSNEVEDDVINYPS